MTIKLHVLIGSRIYKVNAANVLRMVFKMNHTLMSII